MSSNIFWQDGNISREDRLKLLAGHNKVIWLTGLSGSGKTTIARLLEKELHKLNILSYSLDGDNLRHGLNNDLGFSQEDRNENIRRIGEVSKLFYDAGLYVIVSFISPFKEERDNARKLVGKDFIEVFVNCPLDECEKRDVKGLYQKARNGEIAEFTGISSPYHIPENPEIVIDSHLLNCEEAVRKIISHIENETN